MIPEDLKQYLTPRANDEEDLFYALRNPSLEGYKEWLLDVHPHDVRRHLSVIHFNHFQSDGPKALYKFLVQTGYFDE